MEGDDRLLTPELETGEVPGRSTATSKWAARSLAVAAALLLTALAACGFFDHTSNAAVSSTLAEADLASTVMEFDLTGMKTEKCWLNKSFWVERSGEYQMQGTSKTQQISPAACQLLCASTYKCEHFSYWTDGACLLTSYSAYPQEYTGPDDNGVISGPRVCKEVNNGPTEQYSASALGLPQFRAKEAPGCGSLHDDYKLAWSAEGETFFDGWQFINKSETRGAEWYLNKTEAFHRGVVFASKAGATMRVGEQVQPFKRRSVMLHSAQAWRPDVGFIVVMKYKHVPYGPGVWPAFWLVNSDTSWPKGGELDILEYANDETNKVTFHTDKRCNLNVKKMLQCSQDIKDIDPKMIVSCYTNYSGNELGCLPPQVRKTGEWYSKNPGVLALLWDASGISYFHIPESEIPSDLSANRPRPNTWKSEWRMAFMPFDDASCIGIARPQEIVLNIASAATGLAIAGGAVTSAVRQATCRDYCIPGHVTEPATDCCTIYVSNPSAEQPLKTKAFFDIDYVKVFEPASYDLPAYPAGTYRNGGLFGTDK